MRSPDSVWLSVEAQAVQTVGLINAMATEGWVLPRNLESIKAALLNGNGYAIVLNDEVVAYAECRQGSEYHSIHSVVVKPEYRGYHLGGKLIANRLEKCQQRNPDLDVILTCAPGLVSWYHRFGFELMPKHTAPESVRGGRDEQTWEQCDRVWMKLMV